MVKAASIESGGKTKSNKIQFAANFKANFKPKGNSTQDVKTEQNSFNSALTIENGHFQSLVESKTNGLAKLF